MLRAACILMLMASPEGTMTIFAKRIAGAAALGVTMLIGSDLSAQAGVRCDA